MLIVCFGPVLQTRFDPWIFLRPLRDFCAFRVRKFGIASLNA